MLKFFQDGDFLVRESQGSPGQYVLTGMQSNSKKHLLLVDPEGIVSFQTCYSFMNLLLISYFLYFNLFGKLEFALKGNIFLIGSDEGPHFWFSESFDKLSQGQCDTNHFSGISLATKEASFVVTAIGFTEGSCWKFTFQITHFKNFLPNK